MSSTINAHVREGTCVFVQSGGLTVDGVVLEWRSVVLVGIIGREAVDLWNTLVSVPGIGGKVHHTIASKPM